jgi:hypothetical protein
MALPRTSNHPEHGAARQEVALREWAVNFGTTPERLKKAVDAVGIAPRKVRAYLIRDGASRPR